jgi:hypothetical protein
MKVTSEFVQAMDALDQAISAEKFNGYLPLTIPHDLDAIPGQFVGSYSRADIVDRELAPTLHRGADSVLLAFSERQAALAVRIQSQDILRLSVLAIGLASLVTNDERDGMLVMPLPWRTAELLRQEPKSVFVAAAETLPPVAQKALLAFANRDSEDQTLACMGYVEGSDGGGFRYVRTW